MISTSNVPAVGTEAEASASGLWTEDFEIKPPLKWRFTNDLAAVEISIAIASSASTAPLEIFFNERRWREGTTTTWILPKAIGRPISILQAREMALQLMHELENDRKRVLESKAIELIVSEDDN